MVVKIDGVEAYNANTDGLAGKTVKLAVKRGESKEMEMPISVGSREVTAFDLTSFPQPNPKQLKIRSGWLKR